MKNEEGRGRRGQDSRTGDWAQDMVPSQAILETAIPLSPRVAHRAPFIPLSQNLCELAGHGNFLMGRKTKAPGQKGICPDLYCWSVAKVELQGGGAYGDSMASQPLSLTMAAHPPQETQAQNSAGLCVLLTDFNCSSCVSHEARTPLLAALVAA